MSETNGHSNGDVITATNGFAADVNVPVTAVKFDARDDHLHKISTKIAVEAVETAHTGLDTNKLHHKSNEKLEESNKQKESLEGTSNVTYINDMNMFTPYNSLADDLNHDSQQLNNTNESVGAALAQIDDMTLFRKLSVHKEKNETNANYPQSESKSNEKDQAAENITKNSTQKLDSQNITIPSIHENDEQKTQEKENSAQQKQNEENKKVLNEQENNNVGLDNKVNNGTEKEEIYIPINRENSGEKNKKNEDLRQQEERNNQEDNNAEKKEAEQDEAANSKSEQVLNHLFKENLQNISKDGGESEEADHRERKFEFVKVESVESTPINDADIIIDIQSIKSGQNVENIDSLDANTTPPNYVPHSKIFADDIAEIRLPRAECDQKNAISNEHATIRTDEILVILDNKNEDVASEQVPKKEESPEEEKDINFENVDKINEPPSSNNEFDKIVNIANEPTFHDDDNDISNKKNEDVALKQVQNEEEGHLDQEKDVDSKNLGEKKEYFSNSEFDKIINVTNEPTIYGDVDDIPDEAFDIVSGSEKHEEKNNYNNDHAINSDKSENVSLPEQNENEQKEKEHVATYYQNEQTERLDNENSSDDVNVDEQSMDNDKPSVHQNISQSIDNKENMENDSIQLVESNNNNNLLNPTVYNADNTLKEYSLNDNEDKSLQQPANDNKCEIKIQNQKEMEEVQSMPQTNNIIDQNANAQGTEKIDKNVGPIPSITRVTEFAKAESTLAGHENKIYNMESNTETLKDEKGQQLEQQRDQHEEKSDNFKESKDVEGQSSKSEGELQEAEREHCESVVQSQTTSSEAECISDRQLFGLQVHANENNESENENKDVKTFNKEVIPSNIIKTELTLIEKENEVHNAKSDNELLENEKKRQQQKQTDQHEEKSDNFEESKNVEKQSLNSESEIQEAEREHRKSVTQSQATPNEAECISDEQLNLLADEKNQNENEGSKEAKNEMKDNTIENPVILVQNSEVEHQESPKNSVKSASVPDSENAINSSNTESSNASKTTSGLVNASEPIVAQKSIALEYGVETSVIESAESSIPATAEDAKSVTPTEKKQRSGAALFLRKLFCSRKRFKIF